MTLADAVGRDDPLGLAARGLQLVLVGLVGYGAVDGQADLLVNGVLALALTLVPAVVAWRYDHVVDSRLLLWIAVAATAHVIGFLGPYGVQSGVLSLYDNAAHAISASFVAGVAYAVLVALDHRSSRIELPGEFRFVFTLVFVMAFGVAWEIVEFAAGGLATTFGATEVLVQYGVDDIVFDLLFNTLAAVLVALGGTGYFSDLVVLFSRRLPRLGRL